MTKTHIVDLMMLYKKYRPVYDEILFVVYNHVSTAEGKVDDSLCQYDNVLCIEESVAFTDKQGIESVVNSLTSKFRSRFEVRTGITFFFQVTDWIRKSNVPDFLESVLLWGELGFPEQRQSGLCSTEVGGNGSSCRFACARTKLSI